MKSRLQIIFVFIELLLSFHQMKAQDTLPIRRNQIFAEGLGNNFFDPNSNFQAGFFSINYDRKLIQKKNCFVLSFGVGYVRSKGYYQVNGDVKKLNRIDLPIGFLWRYNYKRNGFWFGLFASTALGEINYAVYSTQTIDYFTHPFVVVLSPNLTYQFQTKSEKYFCKLSFSPKFLPSIFSKEYGGDPTWYVFPLWGGISFGGAW